MSDGQSEILCVVTGLLVVGMGLELALSRTPWAIPGMFIYGIVLLWYFGNVVQSGLDELVQSFGSDRVDWAFVQIAVFALVFRVCLPIVVPHFWPRQRQPPYDPYRPIELHEQNLVAMLVALLAVLTAVGLWRVDGDFFSVIFPPLSDQPKSMFGRSAVGSGFDFLVSLGEYTHLAVGGLLGAVAVLASRRGTRRLAWALFAFCLMPYLFQHARHRTLAILAPGLLGFMFLKPISFAARASISGAAVASIAFWFVFMTDARSGQKRWDEAFVFEDDSDERKGTLFVGLEMFDELCHVGRLKDNGRYDPGFCGEYFQELVAFVPRSVWPDKPKIGYDYAFARGFEDRNNPGSVHAILARGLIGQGVANCGDYLGPAVAALLTSLWCGVLTRMWAQRGRPTRLGLFLLGLAVTINLGRGLSFLALFPFVFAYAGARAYEKYGQYNK